MCRSRAVANASIAGLHVGIAAALTLDTYVAADRPASAPSGPRRSRPNSQRTAPDADLDQKTVRAWAHETRHRHQQPQTHPSRKTQPVPLRHRSLNLLAAPRAPSNGPTQGQPKEGTRSRRS